jgi:hypothetical protein
MSVHDVADLLFTARGRIDAHWNVYVVAVVAVVGWLLSRKRTLPASMRALVSFVFVAAAAANLVGLHSSYTFAEALRTDLLRIAGDTPLVETRALLERHSYLRHRTSAIWIQLAIGAAVLAAVWFARGPDSTTEDDAVQRQAGGG